MGAQICLKKAFTLRIMASVPEPFRQIIFSSPMKRNEHPQMSNGRFLANEEGKV